MLQRTVLLVVEPSQPTRAIIADLAQSFAHACEAFRAAWSHHDLWLDEHNRVLGTTVGHRLRELRADQLEAPARRMVLVTDVLDQPVSAYLLADTSSADFAARHVATPGHHVAVLDLETMRQLPQHRVRAGSLPAPRPVQAPTSSLRQALSDAYCPRCNEQRLHRDRVFDARSRLNGQHICNACALIEHLRAAA